jgi:hypothetical protein
MNTQKMNNYKRNIQQTYEYKISNKEYLVYDDGKSYTAQHQLSHYFTTLIQMRRHLYIYVHARARGGAVG